jgi:aspartate racemase
VKSVGIIGGLGPETSAEFYLEVVFGCQKLDNKTRRPLVVMSSVPIAYELENDEIINSNISDRSREYLVAEARRLEKSGVDFLVMPCNSLHVFIKEIRECVKIPVISILEETVKFIKSNGLQKVGLISTSAAVKYKIYENIFKKERIDFVLPNGLQRAEMDKIIQRLTNGNHLNKDRITILSVIAELKRQGCDCIALACTDLQLLLPSDDEIKIFDTMKVLADATIENLLS